jgi:hypothetical protein
MGFFAIEIVLASIAKHDYLCGFFFWLDILSTLSMLLDIGWVSNAIFNTGSGSTATSAVSLARLAHSILIFYLEPGEPQGLARRQEGLFGL